MPEKSLSPYRAFPDRNAFDIGQHVSNIYACLGFEPRAGTDVATPGPHFGVARRGGATYRRAVEYGASKLLAQFDDEKSESADRQTAKAIARFDEAERMCTEANVRFSKYFLGHRPDNQDVAAVLLAAREKIGKLYRNVTLDRIVKGCQFTKGGSVTLPRSQGSPVHKFSVPTETTAQNSSLLRVVFPRSPDFGGGFAKILSLIVEGNKLVCVPKNYDTFRIIAGEPSGQMFIQKGLHSVMRDDLKMVGINLDSQETNQQLACLASVVGWLSTVDLSMASDTAARAPVEWLFSLVPDIMWKVMELTRSPVGKLTYDVTKNNGRKVTVEKRVLYRKFSSMGNALTFEIETSIFWAVAVSACEQLGASSRLVSIYGDDIIIPSRAVPLLGQVLAELGFRFNEDKTFYDKSVQLPKDPARFRESCGKHYLAGHDVTPIYIKEHPATLLQHFHLVNNLVRWLRRLENLPDSPCLKEAWDYVNHLRQLAPPYWCKPRIPDGFGDGAFIGTFDECTPKTVMSRKRPYVEGYSIEVLTERHDEAFGVSKAGNALVWVNGKRGEPKKLVAGVYCPTDLELNQRVLEPVSLEGFMMAKLSKLESQKAKWHTYTQRLVDIRTVALCASEELFESESSGVPLPHIKRVELGNMTIPARASRHNPTGITW